jgi:T-complex protein 1 subunit beta
MRMAKELDELSKSVKGKEALAIEGIAKAMKQLPTIIADNAGYDSAELVANLQNEIYNGSTTAGLDMKNGSIGSMKELGIYECLKVKEQALLSACEAVEQILRVDSVMTSAPRERTRE